MQSPEEPNAATDPADVVGRALPRIDLWAGLSVCVALAIAWTMPLSDARAWGWDESMHAQLPAARMALELGRGEFGGFFDALHGCAQYPFAWPLVLALVQLVTGISEHAGRVAGTLAWCATLFGLFCVAREVVRALRARRGSNAFDRGVPFAALFFGAFSPLALAFAGTFFLEVPAACSITWALFAWLVRARCAGTRSERRAELVAGAAIAVACFTKFNYGLMLALALGLDWAVESVSAARTGSIISFARRTGWLALVPALLGLWWFVLPFPAGPAVAAEHRAAFAAFLGGNQDFARYPDNLRVLFLGAWFAYNPRLLLLELAFALVALRSLREPSVRVLFLVFLATALPIALHPFHDPRFQVLVGPGLWLLSAIGWWTLRAGSVAMRVFGVALFLAALVPTPYDRMALARWAGILPDQGPNREYVLGELEVRRDLFGDRVLPTAGLERHAHDSIATMLAREVGPAERAGWIGMSNEFSPAALHLALLQHGGPAERFLAECTRTLDVDYFGDGAGVTDEALASHLAGFDVVFLTDPPDLKARKSRAGFTVYRERLALRGWEARPLGTVSVARPPNAPLEVTLFACRPKR